tara:strand:- start:648 stop:899 length:252 start_codon:yes stop_codon:yes gene_type:complete
LNNVGSGDIFDRVGFPSIDHGQTAGQRHRKIKERDNKLVEIGDRLLTILGVNLEDFELRLNVTGGIASVEGGLTILARINGYA